MTNRTVFAAVALSVLSLVQGTAGAAQSPGKTKAYRWVDKNGVTHYGDSVPADSASQGASELNSQGVPVRETPRQLSPDEAVAAQQRATEIAKGRERDASLLSTFTNVRDIEQLRDERVALIEGQMDIVRGSLASADQRITALQNRMRNFQPYSTAPTARRLPDQLAGEAIRALKERHGMQEALNSRELEKNELRARFDSDIARYRELTSRPSTR